jgi:hypothetical protein
MPWALGVLIFGMLSVSGAVIAACGAVASGRALLDTPPQSAPLLPSQALAASAPIVASEGGTVAVTDRASALFGAEIDVPPGALRADARISIAAPDADTLPMFPGLPVLRVVDAPALAAPVRLRLPYSEDFRHRYNVSDPQALMLFALDGDGLWRTVPATVRAGEHVVEANVEEMGTFAVAPSGLLAAWQQRQILGAAFTSGAHNVLVIHGWNSSPWDGCMLSLTAALSAQYDNVAAYAYPSALDIAANAAWLRDRLRSLPAGTRLDIVAFSEGGLVARAAIEPGAWNNGRTIGAAVRALVTIATPHEGLLPDALPSVLGDVAASQMRAGSPFLRALDAYPAQGATRYFLLAGTGAAGGASDGTVPLASALGHGVLAPAATATLPLVHAPYYGGPAAMPCDARVYEQIVAWTGR